MIKSDDAVQQVKEVINYYNYFTSDEKIQFQQKLRTTYLYSAAKKQKLLADMYLKHQLYVRALIAYQKLETVSGKLNAAEQIQVLYNLMTSVNFQDGKHNDNLINNGGFTKYDRITAFSGKDFALIYNYSGRSFELNLEALEFKPVSARWLCAKSLSCP